MARLTGTVKLFDDAKGHGIITFESDGREQTAFVHHSAIQGKGRKTLPQGVAVSFNLSKRPNGAAAINVRVGA